MRKRAAGAGRGGETRGTIPDCAAVPMPSRSPSADRQLRAAHLRRGHGPKHRAASSAVRARRRFPSVTAAAVGAGRDRGAALELGGAAGTERCAPADGAAPTGRSGSGRAPTAAPGMNQEGAGSAPGIIFFLLKDAREAMGTQQRDTQTTSTFQIIVSFYFKTNIEQSPVIFRFIILLLLLLFRFVLE